MMSYILLYRNPRTHSISAIMNDDDTINEFKTEDEAQKVADVTPLTRAWGYEAVEVNL